MASLVAGAPERSTRLAAARSSTATAGLIEVDGRTVSWFRLSGGRRSGAVGPAEGEVIARAVTSATRIGVPVVGELSTSGADVTEGVAALHAWGYVARVLVDASGVVPIILGARGPCLSGPALLLGLADHVVMTDEAFAYVSGPDAVAALTGVVTDHRLLGGAHIHAQRTGVATLVVPAPVYGDAVADVLSFLPDNSFADPPVAETDDPPDRRCDMAARVVPSRAEAAYDTREIVNDVLDRGTFLELGAHFAPNIVTGYGRLAGRAVGVVANQPRVLAGVLDITASQKAAAFVQSCDAFNIPVLTFVDTPGFQPGKDLEWRGMIRHGAQLVHAYAEATVPRVSVIVRKAYGGAYIVMDSRGLGSDLCLAWPDAEVAVMGARGAVRVLHQRRLDAITEPEEREAVRSQLEGEYAAEFLNPWRAAERGYVDEVVEPADTRRALWHALRRIATKQERVLQRRHSNSPL